MSSIRIAAAQSISIPGDIDANAACHSRFIEAAQRAEVDLLIFPELSLTGYELPLLKTCVVGADDERLAPLRMLAQAASMTVAVGAPAASDDGTMPAIGAIIYFPDGGTAVYRKQYLHAGEQAYATPGRIEQRLHALRDESCAMAICADTAHEEHAANAARAGASLYLAGVLVSGAGYATDSAYLQSYAAKYAMGVLMANHGGPSGGYATAGKSAFWATGGRLVAVAPDAGNYLLVVDNDSREWSGEVMPVSI